MAQNPQPKVEWRGWWQQVIRDARMEHVLEALRTRCRHAEGVRESPSAQSYVAGYREARNQLFEDLFTVIDEPEPELPDGDGFTQVTDREKSY